ncbi:MAG: HlyD family efflux transporter periplasmic adaptor subunit [Pasteurellaceae bacterium]|nr:HlyD family efflux transporter periplasmic adaptor subunit [Pasteurellaceae bacterium]
MKKFLFALLLIAAAGGYAFWKNHQLQQQELVGIAQINGRMELKRLDVATLYAGRVEEMLVNDGDNVAKDQPVARLSASQITTQLTAADARKQQAMDAVNASKAQIEAAQQQVNLAKLDLDNARKMRAENLISNSELQRRQSTYNANVASLNAAQAQFNEAQSAVKQAQAQIDQVADMHSDMLVKAPIAGRVEFRIADVGNVLAVGGRVISLLDPTDCYLNVYLPAQQANQLRIGDEARIKIDGIDAVLPSTIDFVASQAQFTPKAVETADERAKLMFRVKLRVPQTIAQQYQSWLKGGMTAVGFIKYDQQASWPDELNVNLPTVSQP